MPEQLAAIGMGSNVGDRVGTLFAALSDMARLPGTRLVRWSSFRETDPVGPVAQGKFINAVAVLATRRTPGELLDDLFGIERRHGRDRPREQRMGPRTLDLDILLFGDLVVNEPGLTIPHPRMHERKFVLEPLEEVRMGRGGVVLRQTSP